MHAHTSSVSLQPAHPLRQCCVVRTQVGVLNLETHVRSILAENMEDFKQLAEMLAQEPGRAPPRRYARARSAARAMPTWVTMRTWRAGEGGGGEGE